MPYPTYEESLALLKAPWKRAKMLVQLSVFDSELLELGDEVWVRPYHNDPTYLTIRFQGKNCGNWHEYTETPSYVEILEN